MSNNAYKIDRQRLIQFVTWKLGNQDQKGLTKIPKDMQGTLEQIELPGVSHDLDPIKGYIPGKWDVTVLPATPHRSHRILITCKCGQKIPSGRLHQHIVVCKADHTDQSDTGN